MKKFFVLFTIVLFTGVIACSGKEEKADAKRDKTVAGHQMTNNANNEFEGVVLSTQDASRYTYIKYKTADGKELWAAVSQTRLNKGDKIKLINAQPMMNFESKSLKKRFDKIYFAEGVIVNGKQNASNPHKMEGAMPKDGIHSGKNPHISENITNVDTSKVKKLNGGVTVKEILDNPANFKGKTVKLRAVVVKFLPDIMKMNWVHLKDASTDKDITMTTKEKFKVGDTVEVQGVVAVDKDFGFGYYYKVLIEGGKRIK